MHIFSVISAELTFDLFEFEIRIKRIVVQEEMLRVAVLCVARQRMPLGEIVRLPESLPAEYAVLL